MAYRNKTFVSFASEDIRYYRLMQAWKNHEHIDFDFHDAHDLNTARDSSQAATIERRLTERLQNTKQVIMLIGDLTRGKAEDGVSFIHHESCVIKKLGIPVVFANLNSSRVVERNRLPGALLSQYTVSVSFQPRIIMQALDNYGRDFWNNLKLPEADRKKGPHQYGPGTYEGLGL